MSGDPRRGRQGRPTDPFLPADPYATLGLPSGASIGEVKRAYRRLAKAFHPDSAGAEALPRFLAIHEAYDRITTGRVLPGSSPPRPAATPREPWRADPARARATRGRGSTGWAAGAAGPSGTAGTAGTGRSTSGASSTGASGGAGASGTSTGGGRARGAAGGRRHATRKATLGSTSYDDARDRADATWSGASWYGPTTGEYWIINPREYADPRKHGPAYQARIRQRWADEAARSAANAEAEALEDERADVPPGEGVAPPGTAAADTPAADDRAADDGAARARTTPAFRPAAPVPERPLRTGDATPFGDVTADTIADDEPQPLWSRWPLLGDRADDPMRRFRLALVAWPPLGAAAAIAAGDVTGCAAYAASCTGAAPLLPWLAQVVILALLLLLPPLARLLAFGTVAVLLALVPATAVLIAFGAGGAPQAGFALGVLLALAWLVGVALGAVSAARRASLSSI